YDWYEQTKCALHPAGTGDAAVFARPGGIGHLCRSGRSLCPIGLAHAPGARRVLPPERYAGLASQPAAAATEVGGPACRWQVGARLVRRPPVRVAATDAAPVRMGRGASAGLVH